MHRYVIIKEFQNTKKADAKLEIALRSMKDMQLKISDIEEHIKEVGENLRHSEEKNSW